jgi:hypothetical protein
LYEEHEKFVSVQKSLALETKRNEMLSSELSACHESISSLKNLNDELNAKLEEVSKTSSCVEHVNICNRCKDFDVDAGDEHLISITKLNDEVASLNAQLKTCKIDFDKLKFARDLISITKLNDEVASLNAQLKTCKIDFDKLKFARDAYTIGRHPSIKDGLGFRKETKNLTSQRIPVLNKEKGKAPMASSSQKNHAYIYDRKIASHSHYNKSCVHTAYNNSHAMFASSSTFVYGRSRSRRNHVVPHMPRRMCNEPTTVFHACNTSFVLSCKNEKVVARKLGSKCKGDKTCICVLKIIVTNLAGPNKSWEPKT